MIEANYIDNIEALFLLFAPNLKFVDLDDNKITCCKDFFKSKWKEFNKV